MSEEPNASPREKCRRCSRSWVAGEADDVLMTEQASGLILEFQEETNRRFEIIKRESAELKRLTKRARAETSQLKSENRALQEELDVLRQRERRSLASDRTLSSGLPALPVGAQQSQQTRCSTALTWTIGAQPSVQTSSSSSYASSIASHIRLMDNPVVMFAKRIASRRTHMKQPDEEEEEKKHRRERIKDDYRQEGSKGDKQQPRALQKLNNVVLIRTNTCCAFYARMITDKTAFHAVVMFLILANAAFIGYTSESDLGVIFNDEEAFDLAQRPWADTMEYIFTASFTTELLLRLVAQECQFFVGPDRKWNVFDSFVVIATILDLVLQGLSDLSVFRVLRLVRVVRSLRMISVLRYASNLRSLRLMVGAITESAVPLFWAALCVCLITYVFAVIFMQAVAVYAIDAHPGDPSLLKFGSYFGTLPVAVLTLFAAATGGLSSWEVANLLTRIGWGFACLFIFYIFFMVLAAMNIVTGIFVNDALEVAARDNDLMISRFVEQSQRDFEDLQQLFLRLTMDGVTLSLSDFTSQLKNDDVRVIFARLGIDVTDAESFFHCLDVDGSEALEIDEFVMGCLRFKGSRNSFHLEVCVQRVQQMLKRQTVCQVEVNQKLASLELATTDIQQRLAPLPFVKPFYFDNAPLTVSTSGARHILTHTQPHAPSSLQEHDDDAIRFERAHAVVQTERLPANIVRL